MEDTPEEFVNNLVEVFREVKRVLRDDGTVWLNLGDSYCGTGNKGKHTDPKHKEGRSGQKVALNNKVEGLKSKDLVGILGFFIPKSRSNFVICTGAVCSELKSQCSNKRSSTELCVRYASLLSWSISLSSGERNQFFWPSTYKVSFTSAQSCCMSIPWLNLISLTDKVQNLRFPELSVKNSLAFTEA